MEIEALKYLFDNLEREMADRELIKSENQTVKKDEKGKVIVYNPAKDGIGEFKGKFDDWYGDQKDE